MVENGMKLYPEITLVVNEKVCNACRVELVFMEIPEENAVEPLSIPEGQLSSNQTTESSS